MIQLVNIGEYHAIFNLLEDNLDGPLQPALKFHFITGRARNPVLRHRRAGGERLRRAFGESRSRSGCRD